MTIVMSRAFMLFNFNYLVCNDACHINKNVAPQAI